MRGRGHWLPSNLFGRSDGQGYDGFWDVDGLHGVLVSPFTGERVSRRTLNPKQGTDISGISLTDVLQRILLEGKC